MSANEQLEAASPGPAVAPGDFLADTKLRADPDRPGTWLGSIPEAWRVVYAFGGISMAMALRGAQSAVDRPDLHLLSANAVFCSPVRCGPVEVETQVLRSGRTAAQGLSFLRNAGSDEVGVCVTATWGEVDPDAPISHVDATFPSEAGRPDDHEGPPPRTPDDPFPEVAFHQQTEWRMAIGNRWWDPPEAWTDGGARSGSWTRLIEAPTLPDGTLDPVSLCVPADQLGSAVGQMIDPTRDDVPHFFTVTLEMGLQVLAPTAGPWLLQHVRAPHAADGYATSIVELWDEDERLVAIADQRARLRLIQPGDGFFT